MSMESDTIDPRWKRATWNERPGLTRQLLGYLDNEYDFSLKLPPNTNPSSIRWDYYGETSKRLPFYIVRFNFRISSSNISRRMQIPEVSSRGNRLMEFSASLPGELEKIVGQENLNLLAPILKL